MVQRAKGRHIFWRVIAAIRQCVNVVDLDEPESIGADEQWDGTAENFATEIRPSARDGAHQRVPVEEPRFPDADGRS